MSKINGWRLCCVLLNSLVLALFAGCSSSPQPSQLTRSRETLLGNVDVVADVAVRDGKTAVSLTGKTTVTVAGWAITDAKAGQGQKMMMSVNGTAVACEYGLPRADVAAALHNDAVVNSGYTCQMPAGTFSRSEERR